MNSFVLKQEEVPSVLDGTKTQIRLPFEGEPYQYDIEDRKDPNEWWLSCGRTTTGNWRGVKVCNANGRLSPHAPFSHSYYLPRDEWLKSLCPIGQAGNSLWVKETWGVTSAWPTSFQKQSIHDGIWYQNFMAYKADSPQGNWDWRSSLHMQRWASRMSLLITDVSVERIQDITSHDAQREGVWFDGRWWRGGIHKIKGTPQCWPSAVDAFQAYWKQRFGSWNWESNRLVWAITFKRVNHVR